MSKLKRPRGRKGWIAARAAAPRDETIVITYNVPIPHEARGRMKFNQKYPFALMRPGGSFWVPQKMTNGVSSAMGQFARKSGWKFIARSQSEDGRPAKAVNARYRGTRVWRVS